MFDKSALLNLATIEARKKCFAVADAIHDNSISYDAFVDLMAEKNVAVEVVSRLEAERDGVAFGESLHPAELPAGDDFLARVYATRDLAECIMDECLDAKAEGILTPAQIVAALRDMADGIEQAEAEIAAKRDAAERLDDEWNATQAAATAAMNRLDEQREIVTDLGEARLQLRLEGNFAAADAVKARLWEMGWECQDHGNYKSHMTRRAA